MRALSLNLAALFCLTMNAFAAPNPPLDAETTFAKANALSVEDIANIIKSYLRNRT